MRHIQVGSTFTGPSVSPLGMQQKLLFLLISGIFNQVGKGVFILAQDVIIAQGSSRRRKGCSKAVAEVWRNQLEVKQYFQKSKAADFSGLCLLPSPLGKTVWHLLVVIHPCQMSLPRHHLKKNDRKEIDVCQILFWFDFTLHCRNQYCALVKLINVKLMY